MTNFRFEMNCWKCRSLIERGVVYFSGDTPGTTVCMECLE